MRTSTRGTACGRASGRSPMSRCADLEDAHGRLSPHTRRQARVRTFRRSTHEIPRKFMFARAATNPSLEIGAGACKAGVPHDANGLGRVVSPALRKDTRRADWMAEDVLEGFLLSRTSRSCTSGACADMTKVVTLCAPISISRRHSDSRLLRRAAAGACRGFLRSVPDHPASCSVTASCWSASRVRTIDCWCTGPTN